jgi:hypothetical protein
MEWSRRGPPLRAAVGREASDVRCSPPAGRARDPSATKPTAAPAPTGRRGLLAAAATAVLVEPGPLLARPALAQAARYPSRPIQIIVPWAAGGGTDAVARMIAALLEREFGQPVGVVNRIGGTGVVGHTAIAEAPPDGHTIGMLTLSTALRPGDGGGQGAAR